MVVEKINIPSQQATKSIHYLLQARRVTRVAQKHHEQLEHIEESKNTIMRKRREQTPYEPAPAPRLLTVLQVADALGVGKDTVYNLIKYKGLPTISVAIEGTRKKLRISVSSLNTWIKEHEQAHNPEANSYSDIYIPTSKRIEMHMLEHLQKTNKDSASSEHTSRRRSWSKNT